VGAEDDPLDRHKSGPGLFFDIGGIIWPDSALELLVPEPVRNDLEFLRQMEASHHAVAAAIRALGPHRILFGTDWVGEDWLLPFGVYLETLRVALPLDRHEWTIIFGNSAPYVHGL
jgi:hypothetical protein